MSEVIDDNELKRRLIKFFARAQLAKNNNSTKGIITKDIANKNTKYKEMNIKVSFGQGSVTRIPWMTFLQIPFTTSEGVYPYIGADIDNNKIISHIGYSEDKDVIIPDKARKTISNINEYEKHIIDFKNIDENIIDELLEYISSTIISFKEIDFKIKDDLFSFNDENNEDKDMPNNIKQIQPLNQILYGPPGTGKTYNTINKAIEIIENRIVSGDEDREDLKEKFEDYKENGQIEFVTFHQSYGYEEFVEGIKAKTNEENKQIEYEIEPGVFKRLCEKAQEVVYKNDSIEFDSNSKIWKVSLAGSGDNKIKSECYKDGYIRFSYEEKFNENINDKSDLNIPLNALVNKMDIGDIIVSLDTHKTINQIGIIESEYLYLEKYENYKHSRKVKWLLPEAKVIDFYEINGNTSFANSSIHEINPNKEKFFNLIPEQNIEIKDDNKSKNYILIIDEINRGNISKVFGELITLIEDSKRAGNDEAVEITLPYSGDKFSVPKNLYIIGTMNTADRSIAPIDTALRRRFVFEEMAPNPNLVSKNIEGVNLQELLTAINTRIEYLYDRDHTIGHAYLLDVKTLDDLKFAFKNKILPLLEEYFYEDWANIDMVLNSNDFIKTKEDNSKYLSNINNKYNGKKIYEIKDESNWKIKNFIKIYDDEVNLED